MLEAGLPVGVRVEEVELVGSLEVLVLVGVMEFVVGEEHRSGGHHVGACLVEGHGVGGGEDSEVGHHGGVIVVPAVAFRADVHDEADVEVGLPFEDGFGVFGDLAVEALRGVPVGEYGGVVLAEGYALAASHAFGVVDHCLALLVEVYGVVGAVAHADAAAHAVVAVDLRLRGSVELELAGDACAPHAEVLERASETGLLMPLEVGERHHDVGIGEGRADFRGLAVFAVSINSTTRCSSNI